MNRGFDYATIIVNTLCADDTKSLKLRHLRQLLSEAYVAGMKSADFTWRCFHCGYVAQTEEDGIRHYGVRGEARPVCVAEEPAP